MVSCPPVPINWDPYSSGQYNPTVFPRGAQRLVMYQMQMQTGHWFGHGEQTIMASAVFPLADAPTERNPLFRGPLPRQQNKSAISQLYRQAAFQTWRPRDHQSTGALVAKYKANFQLHMQVSPYAELQKRKNTITYIHLLQQSQRETVWESDRTTLL